MGFTVRPVGRVESILRDRASAPRQGDEGAPDCTVAFEAGVADALKDVATGAELLLLTWLDRADRDALVVQSRLLTMRAGWVPPKSRKRSTWTRIFCTQPATTSGEFSTRSPDRPNPLGLHRVTVLEVDGTRLRVSGLEAIDGTPVLDVKPVLGGVDER